MYTETSVVMGMGRRSSKEISGTYRLDMGKVKGITEIAGDIAQKSVDRQR